MDFLVLHEEDTNRWESFHSGTAPEPRSPVMRRWQRVQPHGVNPDGPPVPGPLVDQTDLRLRRERLESVRRMARSSLMSTVEAFSRNDFRFLLTDTEGVVLDTFTDGGDFSEQADRVRLIEGAHWSESLRGTNAIGTALAEKRPVVVGACAHFERPNHGLICYASPIRDPMGETIGVLDATSFVHRAEPLARVAIRNATRAVEEVLKLQAYADSREGSLESIADRLASFDSPALLVERSGHIRLANRDFKRFFGASHTQASQALGLRWSDIEGAALSGEARIFQHARSAPMRVHAAPIIRDGHIIAATLVLEPLTRSTRPAAPEPAEEVDSAFASMFGDDPDYARAKKLASRFASTPLPVLLLAETGTGKELMARAIHRASGRSREAFVAINCGGLNPSLLESELFGYAPGAFTGANRDGQKGRVEAADGGTLFLDEVAEMPPALQTALLRFLENGTYHRVGEPHARQADVRLICATCRDLPGLVDAGEFRQDLYFRIRGACITLPPLRERDDIVGLARHLLESIALESGGYPPPELSEGALRWLRQHHWPGNVRELKTALHYACILAEGQPTITCEHLPMDVDASRRRRTEAPTSRDDVQSLEEAEANLIRQALTQTHGNVSAAARKLGIARSTLYRKMEQHGI